MTNRLELIQYLLDEIEKSDNEIERVKACYPAGHIRESRLAELRLRRAADRHTLNLMTDAVVASIQ